MRTTKNRQETNQDQLVNSREHLSHLLGKYIITIRGNHLEPRLRDGYKVSGKLIEKDNWSATTGLIAVLIKGKITTGRVVTNELAINSTLTLTADNPLCNPVTIRATDLEFLFSLESIISGIVV